MSIPLPLHRNNQMHICDENYEDDFESGDDFNTSVSISNEDREKSSVGHAYGNIKKEDHATNVGVSSTLSESSTISSVGNRSRSRCRESSLAEGGLIRAPMTSSGNAGMGKGSLYCTLSDFSTTSSDLRTETEKPVKFSVVENSKHPYQSPEDEERASESDRDAGLRTVDNKGAAISSTSGARANNLTNGLGANNKHYSATRVMNHAGLADNAKSNNSPDASGASSSLAAQIGRPSANPEIASSNHKTESLNGVMHRSNVMTVWMLNEEPEHSSFQLQNLNGSVNELSTHEGRDPIPEGAVEDSISVSGCSSSENVLQKKKPTNEEEHQSGADLEETPSFSSSLSSFRVMGLPKAQSSEQGAVKGIISTTSHCVSSAQQGNPNENHSRLEGSLASSHHLSVTIVSPNSKQISFREGASIKRTGIDLDASSVTASPVITNKGLVMGSEEPVQLDSDTDSPSPPAPTEKKKIPDPHASANVTDTPSKLSSPSGCTIWKTSTLPFEQKLQKTPQKIPASSPPSLESDAVGKFQRQVIDLDDRHRDSSVELANPHVLEGTLMQQLRSLKDQIALLNRQIETKEREIANVSRARSAEIAPGRGRVDRNNMRNPPSLFSKGGVRGGKRMVKNNRKAVPPNERLEKLRLINKDLEEKLKQYENEITIENLIDEMNRRLEGAKERLKEAQIVKRGLESCDKRVEHMIQALHCRRPSSEEIKSRQVNENMYSHVNLDRKIEQLKESIRLREASREVVLAKCQELEETLRRKNYASGVSRGDLEQLKATFESNKRKIDQLRAAIAIYRHAVSAERQGSSSRRGTRATSVSSRRSLQGREAAEDRRLSIHHDAARQRRQELEEELRALAARLAQRRQQIETNLSYDPRARHGSREGNPGLSVLPPACAPTPTSPRRALSNLHSARSGLRGRAFDSRPAPARPRGPPTPDGGSPPPPPFDAGATMARRDGAATAPRTPSPPSDVKADDDDKDEEGDKEEEDDKEDSGRGGLWDVTRGGGSRHTRPRASATPEAPLPLRRRPQHEGQGQPQEGGAHGKASTPPLREGGGEGDTNYIKKSDEHAKLNVVHNDIVAQDRPNSNSDRSREEEVDDDVECEMNSEEVTESSGRSTPLWLRES